MSQHLNSMPSRSEVATYDFGLDTITNLQTAMVTYAGNLPNNTTRNIVFSVSTVSDPFVVTTYVGTLTRIAATRIIVNVYQSMNSAVPIFGKYKDGTWEWNIAALNRNITSLPNTLKSSYNVLIDTVQISQTETVYTLYGSRKFSDYVTLYITPMVEGYFRPGCVIPRSTFAGNGNGTSFTYPSGGIDVEVVIKYLSDTQVKMKYNASAARDVRIYLGALKLEY